MEDLKTMKKNLIHCVQAQINGNLKEVDAEELGEAVDMIKDLEEAIYYATITKAMEEGEKQQKESHQQYQQPMYYPYLRDMDRPYGRMYYDDIRYNSGNYNMDRMYNPNTYAQGNMGGSSSNGSSSSSSSNGGGARNYHQDMIPYYEYPMEMIRDPREGRSPMSRKTYMESKEMHKDEATNLKELEKYLQELGQDVTEMVQKASSEEKQMLQQKLSLLASKIK